MRYFVTNDELIPLYEQPENGYTKLQAIERAQREAEKVCNLFNISINEAIKWFHIVDDNYHYCIDLDSAI